MKEYRFYKTERLCSKKDIEELFSSSESIFVYPFKVVFKVTDYSDKECLKLGISVSKRYFKRAVKRNFIKRRIREGFRLNKPVLKETLKLQNIGVHLMLVYISKETMEFNEIESKIGIVIEKLTKILSKPAGVVADSAD